MKVKWMIELLDGTEKTVECDVDKLPTPGDGKVIDGVWGRVTNMVTDGPSGVSTIFLKELRKDDGNSDCGGDHPTA